jgi:hypothetical protein
MEADIHMRKKENPEDNWITVMILFSSEYW